MSRIKLAGLKSGVPIGFMAALGAFRNAVEIEELGEVRLSWQPYGGQWCAALDTANACDSDHFARLIAAKVKTSPSRREFEWSEALKDLSPAEFREHAERALDNAALTQWFQSFGSELCNKNDKLQSTPFDMTVARQKFLADAAWLTNNLATPDKRKGDGPNIASFQEALYGPWKYEDNQHSLGWDPSTILMGAFTPKAPTAMNKAGVRAAVWLAMESLPFFACFYDGGLATVGFQKRGRREMLRWPIWESPLTISSVRVLMQHALSIKQEEMRHRGIVAIYSSRVFKPNKYLTSFQPAVLEMT